MTKSERKHLPSKALIGMVHVRALPGTPNSGLRVDEICRLASREAVALVEAGFDALLLENMHDVPYLKRSVGPEIVAAMTAAALAVRAAVPSLAVGVQVLAGANREAIAVAQSAGLDFIRAEGFVFAHVADEGIMESDAGELLRYRRAIGAENVGIYADIKKKHSSHAITADTTLAETAHAAEFFGADGVVVTGTATGAPTNRTDVEEAAAAVSLPVLVGSGVTPENLAGLWPAASGFIVGSYLKQGGRWDAELDPDRLRRVVTAARALRDARVG